MKKLNDSQFKYTLHLSFGIPFVGLLVVLLLSECEPFGKYAILYSDGYHQYYPFFINFREALRSGNGLFYNWNFGMGLDYLGLISYYLASPLYWLCALVPDSLVLEFYSLLMPLRLGLAGLFFGIFLKQIFHRNDVSVAVFASFYALCAWALGYQWNVMWLDTFALTPLVALGTVKILKDRKFVLYTLTLFLAVYANYYIGFFVCIFVLLICLCWEICRWQGFKRLFADIGLMLFFSLLAVGMTAILELPALAALQNTQSSVNKFPTGFDINIGSDDWMGLLDAMRQVAGNMAGGLEMTIMEGLPNLYCGVGTIMFALLYLMAPKIRFREKFCALALLIFMMMSFIIRQLDYIWHGFHFTNMIPYRFSFLYSFVMLYMAYRAWTLRNSFKVRQVILAGLLTILLLGCNEHFLESAFQVNNGVMLVLYVAFMSYGVLRKKIPEDAEEEIVAEIREAQNLRRRMATKYLVIILCGEMVLNLINFGFKFPINIMVEYPRGTNRTETIISYMNEREADNLFFRAETTHAQTLNDGALNGYNGISTFTSSANAKVTEFMRCLGYGAKNTFNRYCYEEASPVSNLFLGIKYMIDRESRDRESSIFTAVHSYDSVTLLENNYYLPLGFLAEDALGDVIWSSDNSFGFQNRLFSATTGVMDEVWSLEEDLVVTGEDVTITEYSTDGHCSYTDALENGTITYEFIVQKEGFFCIQLYCHARNDVTILHNGTVVMDETLNLEQMLAVADVELGDVVEVRLTCEDGESSYMNIAAAVLNQDVFQSGYEVLSASVMEVTAFENTRVEGVIDCDRDGLLYTSIPQNGNWSVLVDGEPAEVTLVGDVMVGVKLTEGQHTLAFVYENAAFNLGWKISAGCLLVFVILAYVDHQIRGKKGKYQR